MASHLSTLATLIFVSATIPQLVQLYRTKDASDFNVYMLALNMVGNLLLMLHGFRSGDYGILALACWGFLYNCLVLAYKLPSM